MNQNVVKILSKLMHEKVEEDDFRLIFELQEEFRQLERIANQYKSMDKKDLKRYLGHFQISSGSMMVTDPCYEVGTWCQHKLDNVKNGDWYAFINRSDEGDWGVRVSSLVAYIGKEPNNNDFQLVEGADIGVDSGQAGFFDLKKYPNVSELDDEFYDECCSLTDPAGVLDFGVVSHSGYGDGGYNLYVVEKNGKIVATKIVFINDEKDEE